MVDVVEGLAEGKALDLAEASPILGKSISLTGGTDNALMKGSDLVVVTAGVARKPGMSRDDLLEINKKIVGGIADDIRRHAPSAVVIVVTNPLDAMAHLTLRRTGFPRERVIGMAGELDTARFRYFIARELNVAGQDVQAILLGGHGDGMVPLPEYTTVNGIPLGQLLSQERIDALVQRTVDGGAEIVKLLKQGTSHPARRAEAVLRLGPPAGGVWLPRPLPRSACGAREGRPAEHHRAASLRCGEREAEGLCCFGSGEPGQAVAHSVRGAGASWGRGARVLHLKDHIVWVS